MTLTRRLRVLLLTAVSLERLDAQAPVPVPEDITVTARIVPSLVPLVGGSDFISPMGEPFHSQDRLSGAEHGFVQADANRSGGVTLAEFRADAERFFETLDSDRDGVIGPDEISRYENEIAPEIHVTSAYAESSAKTDPDGSTVRTPYPSRLGAGRYGYLAMPEPVTYADTNFDRGVTRLEFQQAARKRFRMLDANGAGTLMRQELPRLRSPDRAGA